MNSTSFDPGRRKLSILASLGGLLAWTGVDAQPLAWLSKPVRLVVALAPGAKSNEPWPVGWMWRVDTLLTCCCRITLGKIVVITAVGPPHHPSGTMSMKRGSWSFISSLKLDNWVT